MRVEHSTVSRRIGGLEAALGLRLFDRLPRGWRPTLEGAGLLDRAEAIEREIAALTHAASGVDTLAGEVRISAPPVLAARHVAPGLKALTDAHPKLVLILIGEQRTSDLDRAEADIALRLGEVVGPNLVIRRIGSVGYGLYGRPEHLTRPAAERVYLGFDDSRPDLPQANWLETRAATDAARVGLRSNDLTTLMEAARAGLGLALLPHFAAHDVPELAEVPDDNPFEPRPLYLVMHPDIRRASRVKLVADHLARTVGQALDRFGSAST